jgi:DNA repair protein RAD50
MSLKKKRDTHIQNIFASYNLGSLPKPPFSAEDALNLTNRVKSRLGDLEKDLEDKKVTLLFSLLVTYSLLGAFDWTDIGNVFLLFKFWDFGIFFMVLK